MWLGSPSLSLSFSVFVDTVDRVESRLNANQNEINFDAKMKINKNSGRAAASAAATLDSLNPSQSCHTPSPFLPPGLTLIENAA